MNPADLDAGYRAMAADVEREAEAQAWCNGNVPNTLKAPDATPLEKLSQHVEIGRKSQLKK